MPPKKKVAKKTTSRKLADLQKELDNDLDEEDLDDLPDGEEEEEEEEELPEEELPEDEEDEEEEEEEAPSLKKSKKKKEMTLAEKRAMFVDYEAAQEDIDRGVEDLDVLKGVSNACVKEIHEALGKGPFLRNGKHLVIAVRGDTYFFRGVKGKVEEI